MKTTVNSDNFSAYLSRIPIDKSQKCALVEGIIYNKNYKKILIRNGKKKSGEDFLNNQMIIKLHNM